MKNKSAFYRFFLHIFIIFCSAFLFQSGVRAQNVKRVVLVKIDGLPGYAVDRYINKRDPKTGKSMLPWFDEVFYKNGTRLENFYVRGMSLSGPSWSLLDTGQHLQLKGNVEYDRFAINNQYDYLNFVPFYINYGLKRKVDMPAVELMDQLELPLLSDAFPVEQKYTSPQLLGRGVDWGLFARGFLNLIPKNPRDFIDEWTIGLNFFEMTNNQNERDIIKRLMQNPEVKYFDYYSATLDHIAHSDKEAQSQFVTLKEVDMLIGRLWTAVQKSPQANETALILVSDHGFNSEEKTYSQGFNLVKLLGSETGGGHHVITKRRLMSDYAIKGVYPLVPLVTTVSKDSYYLKNQSDYPTALFDFDGNERSSIHLRDSDLNVLQILLQQLKEKRLSPSLRKSATDAFFDVINRRRENWQNTARELTEELAVLHEWIEAQQPIIQSQPKEYTPEELKKGIDRSNLRIKVQSEIAAEDEKNYREYVRTLNNLLALRPETFDASKIKVEDYIVKGAMGENNSVYKLQNYVVGLSSKGLTVNSDGSLDFENSFKRVNYFSLFESQKNINNVQPDVSNRPIDFVALHIPLDSIAAKMPTDLKPDLDPIWLYGGEDKQAFVLTRKDEAGNQTLRYLPIAGLRQHSDGTFTFQIKDWDKDFPLKIFEDANLQIPSADKTSWLNEWHSETEWFRATHKTVYSNAIIGLNEQLNAHSFLNFDETKNLSSSEKTLRRFRRLQRQLTEADLLLMANNHWNFDVKGFNPGGNHGSFFRVATNSTLMMAGGEKTNIPRGLNISEPYDSLSFVPTVLALMGKVNDKGEPEDDLYQRGFRKFPGRIIQEIVHPPTNSK